MVQVNGNKVEWKATSQGLYKTDVQEHILWQDEQTGAKLVLRKIPKGGPHEYPHHHPDANHWMFALSGATESPDGTKLSVSENNYVFRLNPKGTRHGELPDDFKFTEDVIGLFFFDGPETKIFE
jgi:hypothetical protein